jgi:hypothetical protein
MILAQIRNALECFASKKGLSLAKSESPEAPSLCCTVRRALSSQAAAGVILTKCAAIDLGGQQTIDSEGFDETSESRIYAHRS